MALVIGARLIAALRERDMSKRQLARRLAGPRASAKRRETARRSITRWCAGDAKPNEEHALWLARQLHTPRDHFRPSKAEAANVIVRLEERVAALEEERPPQAEQPDQRERQGDTP